MAYEILLPGPAGSLEAVIENPSESSRKILGIICHPHPLYEGTMNNKVVTMMVKVFQLLHVVPIKFNFRGVGKSEGVHGHSVGEIADLEAVYHWAKDKYPDYEVILAGFSFGAYIAASVAMKVKPLALISIAPAVNHQDFAQLPPAEFPWIVVQGDADEVIPPQAVFDWVASINPKPHLIIMPGVSHFFHGQLITLREKLIDALAPMISSESS